MAQKKKEKLHINQLKAQINRKPNQRKQNETKNFENKKFNQKWKQHFLSNQMRIPFSWQQHPKTESHFQKIGSHNNKMGKKNENMIFYPLLVPRKNWEQDKGGIVERPIHELRSNRISETSGEEEGRKIWCARTTPFSNPSSLTFLLSLLCVFTEDRKETRRESWGPFTGPSTCPFCFPHGPTYRGCPVQPILKSPKEIKPGDIRFFNFSNNPIFNVICFQILYLTFFLTYYLFLKFFDWIEKIKELFCNCFQE